MLVGVYSGRRRHGTLHRKEFGAPCAAAAIHERATAKAAARLKFPLVACDSKTSLTQINWRMTTRQSRATWRRPVELRQGYPND